MSCIDGHSNIFLEKERSDLYSDEKGDSKYFFEDSYFQTFSNTSEKICAQNSNVSTLSSKNNHEIMGIESKDQDLYSESYIYERKPTRKEILRAKRVRAKRKLKINPILKNSEEYNEGEIKIKMKKKNCTVYKDEDHKVKIIKNREAAANSRAKKQLEIENIKIESEKVKKELNELQLKIKSIACKKCLIKLIPDESQINPNFTIPNKKPFLKYGIISTFLVIVSFVSCFIGNYEIERSHPSQSKIRNLMEKLDTHEGNDFSFYNHSKEIREFVRNPPIKNVNFFDGFYKIDLSKLDKSKYGKSFTKRNLRDEFFKNEEDKINEKQGIIALKKDFLTKNNLSFLIIIDDKFDHFQDLISKLTFKENEHLKNYKSGLNYLQNYLNENINILKMN